uniref:DNA topoisomerase 2 n=1 Tax=Astyanax mexicanus TaxID=7994 RepID=A0A8B9HAY4_ASTMX
MSNGAAGSGGLTWVTLFDKNNAAKKEEANGKSEGGKSEPPKKESSKKMSVERVYQKKTQLEHILLRPDTYIGSVEPVTQQMWVFDEEIGMNLREITYVPGLYKIFDEILVNAADNKQRDKNMSSIKITIDPESNTVSIWNNGKGIPVVEHKDEKMYVPALIFGHLLTSSNYDDDEKKVTGGRNGYGAKLCNIFSTKFTVETACKEYKHSFKQTWQNNMTKTSDPKIKYFDGDDFTCVTFQPDLSKFKMEKLDKDIVALLTRRAYDVAGSCKGVKVFLNGKKLPVNGFRSYVDLYVKDKLDETGVALKVVNESVNERWEVCLTMSEKGFQQISFVNSIATTKGGRHIDYVVDQIVSKLIEVVKKKNKAGVTVKPFQVKNHIWVFVNALIENPTFDSQTKENMTLQTKSFGSKCALSEKFIRAATNCGIVESILNWVKFKAQTQLNKKCSSVKHSKIKGIPKLDDANDAGKIRQLKSSLICHVLFDHMGCMKRYESVQDILKEFFELRLHYYKLRKDWLVGSLGAESAKLSNQARFVLEKIEGKISIENKSKRELIRMLVQRGYESDPVAAWNRAQEKALEEEDRDGNESDSSIDSGSSSGPNFNYILNMPLWCLTKEKVDELLKQRDLKKAELSELQRKCSEDLWREDLAVFVEELDRVEEQERESASQGKGVKLVKGKVGKPKVKKIQLEETLPSPFGRRVEPQITLAMKADATKKMTKKKKGEGDMSVKMEFDNDDSVMDSNGATGDNSLISPSGLPTPGAKPKTPRVKKEKKEPGAPRQRKTPGTPKGSAKKVKKRNPWSDDEEEKSFDSDLDDVSEQPVIPRDTSSRRASAVKAKYTFDFSEEEDDDDGEEEQVNDAPASPVHSYKDSFQTSQNNNDEEDDDDDIFPPKLKMSVYLHICVFCSDVKSDSEEDDRGPVFSSFSSSTPHEKPSPTKKAKKPSDTTPKPRKTPAKPTPTKKLDTSVWDSDSDTGAKKTPASGKGAGKGRGRKRKPSGSEEDEYSPMKKTGKTPSSSSSRKQKKPVSDEDEDEVDSSRFSRLDTSRDRSGRAKKEVKYFAESDDDDDDDDMFD